MFMKLYAKPGACSLADHITLRWAGIAFDLELLDAAQMKSPAYLSINPAGSVPALVEGDWALTQNVAILNYIVDCAPQSGLSADNTPRARAEINRWIALVNADIHPTYKPMFGATAYLDDEDAIAKTKDDARTKLRKLYERANDQLSKHSWLANDQRSPADAYLFVTLCWARRIDLDLQGLDALSGFIERMMADPDVQAAFQAEGLN